MRSRRLQVVLRQVGQNVAEARTSKDWSQFQLAEKAGIESRTVQRVEAGETGSLGTLIAPCRRFAAAPGRSIPTCARAKTAQGW